MKKIHALLVTAYLIGGLTLITTTPFSDLRGQLLVNSGGATLYSIGAANDEILHGAANDPTVLSQAVTDAYASARASRQLMLGVLLFTLGGFMHAYGELRSERPVRITVKKRKPTMLFWLEMKL